MLIKHKSDLSENDVTPERYFWNRRSVLAWGAAFAIAPTMKAWAGIVGNFQKDNTGIDEKLTPFESATTYNNFYEFGLDKSDPGNIAPKMFTPGPWSVSVGGECAKPGTLSLEDLIKPHRQVERIYRLRCVEAWSMVIPWIGIPLADVLKRFEPNSKAKYVAFQTLNDPKRMPGVRSAILDWPYREGLRMDEAMNPLTLLAVGAYGKDLMPQSGAPIRLVVPWKYGYKSIKSIVGISFVEKQPPTTWNMSAPREYGFYSNVNPDVDHPRWSQSTERRIGEFLRRKTLPFNGYAEQVASLYQGMDLKVNF
jgi:sulfoxide reductase catalytic subunit YedY